MNRNRLITGLLGAILLLPVSAHAEKISPPWWSGKPCKAVAAGFCDTGTGIVYVDTKPFCQNDRYLDYMEKRRDVWNRTFPEKRAFAWEGMGHTIAKRGYGPPFSCDYALFYKKS